MNGITLLGLNGYAKSGKDTLALGLVEHAGSERRAFADPMRNALYALDPLVGHGHRLRDLIDHVGWDVAKTQVGEVRCLLQRFGTEAGRRVLGEDIWVDALFAGLQPGRRYVVTDVRFPNEANRIRSEGGVLWRVTRSGVGPANNHPSETALDGFRFDEIVENNGTVEDLHSRALALLFESSGQ